MDTPEFQRLAGLRQLGFADVGYRSARHSRFEHSVGAYFVCRTIMRRIVQNHERLGLDHPGDFIDGRFRMVPENARLEANVTTAQSRWRGLTEVVSIAALLHDIGHVPFGHTLEDEFTGLYEKHDSVAAPRFHHMLFARDSHLSLVFSGPATSPGPDPPSGDSRRGSQWQRPPLCGAFRGHAVTAKKTDPHEQYGPKPGSGYAKHGLTTMKSALKAIGGRVIDMRTTLGKALAQWRTELLDDLGGADVVTTQQRAIVDLAVKTKLLVDSLDAWLFAQKSLVNVKRKSVLPVVLQRQQLADALARYMTQLGLERRAKKAPDLTGYLAKQYGGKAGGNGHRDGAQAEPRPLVPASAVTNSSDGDSHEAAPAGKVAS